MLEGKVALITGAAKGIGRAIALAMAAEKATVMINYNGSKERAEQVLEEVKALGADGCVYQCNVADTADTDAMIKEIIKTYGHLDILVNNAGITRDNLIMKMSEEDFDAVINANLKGCFNTIKAVSRQELSQRPAGSSILLLYPVSLEMQDRPIILHPKQESSVLPELWPVSLPAVESRSMELPRVL